MPETHITRLVISMRADPGLLWDVETFVSTDLSDPRAAIFWRAIRSHAKVGEDITRHHVYEAALELGMRLHPARAKALEDAA
jgi:hypothetical protein